jgi:hypothetical protein
MAALRPPIAPAPIWREDVLRTTRSFDDDVRCRPDFEINESSRKLDATLTRYAIKDAERERQEAADQARADAAQARADAYDDAYRSFDTLTPPPVDGERPGQYRKRLYEGLRRKLPDDHELASVRADDIPGGQAARNFEQMMIEAATAEGERPSISNLPRDGSLVARERVDDMGQRSTEFFGRHSFIAEMNRPSLRVVRLMNPKDGTTLMGAPLDRMR